MTISPQTLALFDAQTPTQVDSLLAQTALNLTQGATGDVQVLAEQPASAWPAVAGAVDALGDACRLLVRRGDRRSLELALAGKPEPG